MLVRRAHLPYLELIEETVQILLRLSLDFSFSLLFLQFILIVDDSMGLTLFIQGWVRIYIKPTLLHLQ